MVSTRRKLKPCLRGDPVESSSAAHLSAITAFGQFLCETAVFLLSGLGPYAIRSRVTGVYAHSLQQPDGPVYGAMSFNLQQLLKEFALNPTSVMQQTLECHIRNQQGKTVARIGVKFMFELPAKQWLCPPPPVRRPKLSAAEAATTTGDGVNG